MSLVVPESKMDPIGDMLQFCQAIGPLFCILTTSLSSVGAFLAAITASMMPPDVQCPDATITATPVMKCRSMSVEDDVDGSGSSVAPAEEELDA